MSAAAPSVLGLSERQPLLENPIALARWRHAEHWLARDDYETGYPRGSGALQRLSAGVVRTWAAHAVEITRKVHVVDSG